MREQVTGGGGEERREIRRVGEEREGGLDTTRSRKGDGMAGECSPIALYKDSF